MTHDQEKLIEDTLKDLTAELKTTIGDGELLEVNDMLYYYASEEKQLYEVDFDNYDAEKSVSDITKKSEVSDSDDPHKPRTDSTNDSCPLLKKKKQKEVQKMSEEKEQKEDMYDIEKEDETVQDDSDPKDTISDTVPAKEDIKKEKVAPQIDMAEIKDFIRETIKEAMNDLTKDFQSRESKIKENEKNELVDLLQKEPYGYEAEDLKSLSIKELGNAKSMIEKSKIYKDFMATQEPELPMDIDKQIFTDTVEHKGEDPWKAFNKGYDFGEGEVAEK